jgi:hypothetical protein
VDGDAVDEHQHFAIADAAHLRLLSGRIGRVVRRAGEVHPRDVAQQLVERLRGRLENFGARDDGRVQRNALEGGARPGRGHDNGGQ